jgi:hypothetical protein
MGSRRYCPIPIEYVRRNLDSEGWEEGRRKGEGFMSDELTFRGLWLMHEGTRGAHQGTRG